ncbi:SusC/RagA family TonB-linked outer membrane protein [Bacteroidia bacterium]|nr:SusC/RagA family TonB-linked outer membrane protein [Bacteroidia bacterium]
MNYLNYIKIRETFPLKKTLLIIKIAVIALLAGVIPAHAESYAQETKLTIKENNITLNKLFKQIESKTDFFFFYSNDKINANTTVSVNVEEKTIFDILDQALSGTGITYTVADKAIILSRGAISASVQQQGRRITGTVTDDKGEPVIGANVVEKGTANGTITNIKGEFALPVSSPDAILAISYIGYQPQEYLLKGESTIAITLKDDLLSLNEVVVVGYGVVKKRDLTGSVASINAEKIAKVPAANVTQTMQGRIAGILISNTSTQPGASPSVLIRGKRSISGGSDPLYVVDGIAINGGLNEISPADIESIDVLKDASATAIYGARGSNGVIMITTKKGKEGKTQVDYNGYAGFETVLNELRYMDGGEYAETVRESFRTNNKYASDTPSWELDQQIPTFRNDPYTLESIHMAYDSNGNYDPSKVRADSKWWEAIKRTGIITNHQLNIRGGSSKTQYSVSGTYFKEEGLMKDETYSRFSIRTNIDHQINDYIKAGANSQFAHSLQERGAGLYDAWRTIPVGRLYDENGQVLKNVSASDDQLWNPMTKLEPGAAYNPLKVNNFMGSYYAEIKLPLEGLRFRSNLGLNFRAVQDYEFRSAITRAATSMNSARNSTENHFSYLWDNLLYYDKQIGDHSFGVTALQSIQEYLRENNSIPVQDTPSDALLYYDVASAAIPGAIDSNKQQWNLASFMGRVNYGYKGRYLLTVSARYDGSSRLAEGHQWVMFPAASAAWRMNEEGFLKDIKALSNLKLRLGYGTTASSEVNPYETKGTLSKQYYTYGTNKSIGYAPDRMPNNTLTWETTGQWNLGLDFGFFNNRISGIIDVYMQNTHNLLLDRQLPIVSGFEVIRSNVGRTRNRGVEFTLNTVNIEKKDFTWTTDLMLYTNKEEIVELYNGKVDDVGNSWFIGEAINVFYNYKKVGIWQNTPEDLAEMAKFNANGSNFKPGAIKLWDNGDYTINSDDRIIQGKARPTMILSLNNNFQYKAFDLSFYFLSHLGAMVKNDISYLNQSMRNSNVKVNYWTPANGSNDFPRPIEGVDFLDYYQTLHYEKTDFVRLKNVTLGYTLPSLLTNRWSVSRLRLYAQASNPWIWTSFSGVDPEGPSGYTRPAPASWLFGLNLSF